MSDTKDLQAEVIEVSPTLAKDWLATSSGNRIIRPMRVRSYAADMVDGNWHLNGETVTFDTLGRLRNGHHRMHAVIRSERNVPMLVVRGVEPSADITYDTGTKRTMADVLRMERGETYANEIAATLRWLALWRTGLIRKKQDFASYQVLLDLFDENPGIADSVRKAVQVSRKIKGIPTSVFSIAHFLFGEVVAGDPDALDDPNAFFDALTSGVGLSQGSPVLALANWAHNNTKDRKPTAEASLAVVIKAWNAWRAGEQKQVLSWRAGGSNPEPFPKPR